MCTSPFHFLKKCQELTNEKMTKCPCSKYQQPPPRIKDIRNLMEPIPRIEHQREFDLERVSYYHEGTTQEDKIREQHDRVKKRRQLTN